MVRCRFMIARRCGALAAVLLAAVTAAFAQPSAPARTAAPGPAAASRAPVVALDRVIAVVNDEALTQWDVSEQRRIVLQQMKASNVPPPAQDVLDKQVLERLINERALLQH